MRILQVHNEYRRELPSGENRVVERDYALLQSSGHAVMQHLRSNDESHTKPLATMATFMFGQHWNTAEISRLRATINHLHPDVVHLHNTFPLLSPAIFHTASGSAAATVWTVHNYRPWCVRADFFRDGRSCRECVEFGSGWPALRHRCYRGSLLLTLPTVTSNALHRRLDTYASCPDRIIALSRFHRDDLVGLGLPAERVVIRPHGVAPAAIHPWMTRPRRIVYAGRLGEEKGIRTLVKAYQRVATRLGYELVLAGDGSLRTWCEEQAHHSAGLRVVGALSETECQQLIASARLVVVPSEWPETFGLSVIEAFAHGVPVLASAIAGLPELVQHGINGALFPAGDADALSDSLALLLGNETQLEQLALGARESHARRFSDAPSLKSLLSIYSDAITHKHSHRTNDLPC